MKRILILFSLLVSFNSFSYEGENLCTAKFFSLSANFGSIDFSSCLNSTKEWTLGLSYFNEYEYVEHKINIDAVNNDLYVGIIFYLKDTSNDNISGYSIGKYYAGVSSCPSGYDDNDGDNYCTVTPPPECVPPEILNPDTNQCELPPEPESCPEFGTDAGSVSGPPGYENTYVCGANNCQSILTIGEVSLCFGEDGQNCFYNSFYDGEKCSYNPDQPLFPPTTNPNPNPNPNPDTGNPTPTPDPDVPSTPEPDPDATIGDVDSELKGVNEKIKMLIEDGRKQSKANDKLLEEQKKIQVRTNEILNIQNTLQTNTNKNLTALGKKIDDSKRQAKETGDKAHKQGEDIKTLLAGIECQLDEVCSGEGTGGNDLAVVDCKADKFECKGDVIQCAQLQLEFENSCINSELSELEKSLEDIINVDNVANIVDPDVIDYSKIDTKYLDNGVSIGKAVCPAPINISFTLMGVSNNFGIPFDHICTVAESLRPLVIALSWLAGLLLIGRIVGS